MAATASAILLSNASATGSGVAWPGGIGAFQALGTFGGATVKLQALLVDGSTWSDVGVDVTLTAAGMGGFLLPPCLIRAAVSGGAPSALYASAYRIP